MGKTMKIRIAGNSIRFRLKQPEVTQFKKAGYIKETIEFGPLQEEEISFSLASSAKGPISIEFVNNNVRVLLPDTLVNEWVDTDMVGIENKIESKGKIISVLIEKDFACLDGSPLENEGSFPNPLANCK
jgi:hypothetical protein